MDFKRDYHRLLARVMSGEDGEQEKAAAALGRGLAENGIAPADIARLHAAALSQHIAGQPPDERPMILLRASRLLAEVIAWRTTAHCLLSCRQWAESALRDQAHDPLPPPAQAAATPFRHPLAEATAFLERVAVTDPLTGIYNARHFHIAIEAQVQAASESGSPLSVLLIDVDGLSRFNEAYGHRQGDEALAALARLLMENTRSADFVARCGGDEFAIILPNCTTRQALALAERLRRVIEEHAQPEGLTVSLGVATFPTDAGDDRGLLNVTHQACFLAQRLGGNTVCTALVAEAEPAPGEP